MGEAADDMFDMWIRDSLRPPVRTRRTIQSGTGDFMWRTAEGELLNMYDMTPDHRENAIAMCQRKHNTGKLNQLRQAQQEMRKARPHEFDEDIPFT